MIDIHSHILWGVDDGVSSLEDSVRLLSEAAASGTTDIVATPHANDEFRFDPDLIEQRIAELRARPEPLPRIHRGCDFHISAENIDSALRDPSRYTINGRRYLLVEFPDFFIPPVSDDILARLHARGMVAVITHPERNLVLQRDLSRVERWAEAGFLVQVTALSLLGRFGKTARRVAWQLVESRTAHVIASDAHHPNDRHARLDEAYKAVASRSGEEVAEMLFVANPGAILVGAEVMSPEPVRPRRRWFQLWR